MHFLTQLFAIDPVNLSVKGKLLAVIACVSAIFITATLTQAIAPTPAAPVLIASMGASAIILFIIPNSPLAQPWAFVGGQIIAAFVGISCALFIPHVIIAATVAIASCVALMLFLRCLHPPAAATALTPVLAGQNIQSLGFDYALMPIGINIIIMLGMAILLNRWLMGYDYPVLHKPVPKKNLPQTMPPPLARSTQVSEQTMQQVLEKTATFVDVTAADLCRLFSEVESEQLKQLSDSITCADVMRTPVISVDYGTEVEQAWQLMLEHQVIALPVIDRVQRVIGIVTRHDFLKFVDLRAYQSLEAKIRTFIRRTPDTQTHKPEAVGHIMTSKVTVLAGSCHIVELIPLMTRAGYRQIPIVDAEKRLIGMVYQADLIAALYRLRLVNQHHH